MSELTGVIMLAISIIVLLPVLLLLAEVISAMRGWAPMPMPRHARPRLAVLVPAHDEACGVRNTLDSLIPQLASGDRLLVVADNCTDDTAQVCAAAGVEVIERNDPVRRGKPYALDFGVRHLEADPPEMVVIVDADCIADEGSVDRISRLSALHDRPVQALDLMKAPPQADVMIQIAEFACLLKNLVRPLGKHRLGVPCQLMGTGMAIPWALIHAIPLASDHLSEDVKMGVDCARLGRPPMFCPDAKVQSLFPVSMRDAKSQRHRWEHGHLAMIVGHGPRLLLEAVLSRQPGLLALVADMCVPPLALLALAALAAVAAGAIFAAASGDMLPLQVASAALLGLFLSVFLAWARFGRRVVSFRKLAYAPVYAIGKLPLYVKFLVRRQTEWVRSRRDGS
jgi:cellulose synthase/poly-beta-1,6-N-acetylglucosamine synthase-like glycosyltransferase